MRAARFLDKLRRNGWGWTWRRILREGYAPDTGLGRALHPLAAPPLAAVRRLHALTHRRAAAVPAEARRTLTLFYDLEVCPITYDFAVFLALGEAQRRARGLEALRVIFVPGWKDGLRPEAPEYEAVLNADARRWRLHNLCIPLIALTPACRGYTLCGSRAEAALLRQVCGDAVVPEGYDPAFPLAPALAEHAEYAAAGHELKVLAAPPQGRVYVRQWLETRLRGRKLVTITLRHYKFMPQRNSNLAAWAAFARELDPAEYCVVIVPDTDSAMQPLPDAFAGLLDFREACWNIGLRAALYEAAWLNLGTSGGPSALCWFNPDARYITFKLLVPEVPQATVETLAAHGYFVGKTPAFVGRHQKWVWEDDDLAVIRREFAAMAAAITTAEAAEGGYPRST